MEWGIVLKYLGGLLADVGKQNTKSDSVYKFSILSNSIYDTFSHLAGSHRIVNIVLSTPVVFVSAGPNKIIYCGIVPREGFKAHREPSVMILRSSFSDHPSSSLFKSPCILRLSGLSVCK
jgi:hypothetical protein